MRKLIDMRNAFDGKTVAMVGGAVTTVDYADIARDYDNVVLINWALKIAPLFTREQHAVYFFTWHFDKFAQREELAHPQLIACVSGGHLKLLPAASQERAIVYCPKVIPPYDEYARCTNKEDDRIRDPETVFKRNVLHSYNNSTLLAIHFLYVAGCREIHGVGMHDIGGHQRPHYDLRLSSPQVPAWGGRYMQMQESACHNLGILLKYLE